MERVFVFPFQPFLGEEMHPHPPLLFVEEGRYSDLDQRTRKHLYTLKVMQKKQGEIWESFKK